MNDVIEKWFKKNTLSDLSQAINTFEGLLNFIFASENTQKKVILTDLDKYFFDKEKSELVMKNAINKNFSGFYRNVNYIKENKENILQSYGNWKVDFCKRVEKLGFGKISQAKRKTIKRQISISEYSMYSYFHYLIGSIIPDANDIFDVKNLNLDLANLFLLVNTLQFGFDEQRQNKAANDNIFNNEGVFLCSGYPFDFFVHDRLAMYENKKMKFIVCYKDRISTRIFKSADEAKKEVHESYHFMFSV